MSASLNILAASLAMIAALQAMPSSGQETRPPLSMDQLVNQGVPREFESPVPGSEAPPVAPQYAPPEIPEQYSSEGHTPHQNQVQGPVLKGGADFTKMEGESQKKGKGAGLLKAILGLKEPKNYGPVVRPPWLPGHAYTNDSMVAPYHNMSLLWFDKRPMPNHPQWVQLSRSVSRYWRGFVADPCMVYVEPLRIAPGNFIFHGREPGSPQGWLQSTGLTDDYGFPLYRYWLDQY